ncbi:hypothetical protein FACS189454_02190 [Planctomycetales bacterium]|nr:hypothetical protein FACS189454_02190 [Planctomycetales bacterium]
MYGELVPVGGGDPWTLYKTEILIGRQKDCDIVLPFSNVSAHHCRLVLSEGYWYIIDLQSTNGVKVNGKKVVDYRVDPRSQVAVSKNFFTLEYDPYQNGAKGLPPSNMLQNDNILTQSLLQRAGLQRRALPESTISMEHEKIAVPQPVTEEQPLVKRDFFSELVFD